MRLCTAFFVTVSPFVFSASTVHAQEKVFGAFLNDPDITTDALVALLVDESSSTFSALFLARDLEASGITDIDLQDANGQTVYDLLNDSGSALKQGGRILALNIDSQAFPNPNFAAQLKQGLRVLIRSTDRPDGLLSGELAETDEGFPPSFPPAGGDTTTDDEDPLDDNGDDSMDPDPPSHGPDVDSMQPTPGDGNSGQSPPDNTGDGPDALTPTCGACGPVGLLGYFCILLGFLGLRLSPRRQ